MGNDILSNYNTGRRFVSNEHVDYSVPEFLADKFDNVLSPKDFNAVYFTVPPSDETPLWWKAGIDIPLTKRERNKQLKVMAQKLKVLEERRAELEKANEAFITGLAVHEKEYKLKLESLERLSEEKLRQIEIFEKNMKLKYEQELLSLDKKLQEERTEAEILAREEVFASKLGEAQVRADLYEENCGKAIFDINSEIKEEREKNELLKKALIKRYTEMGITYTPPAVTEETVIKPQRVIFEKFNNENILEIKSLTMLDRETMKNEFENVSFDVKRKGKTLVLSSAEAAYAIESALMRTFPSYKQISSGEIRVDGCIHSEVSTDEFKNLIHSKIVNVSYIADKFARTPKSVKKLLNNKFSEEFNALLPKLCIDNSALNEKLNKLDPEIRMKLAIAFGLTVPQAELLLFPFVESELGEAGRAGFFSALNETPDEKAVLVLTADKDTVKKVRNITLYVIKQNQL